MICPSVFPPSFQELRVVLVFREPSRGMPKTGEPWAPQPTYKWPQLSPDLPSEKANPSGLLESRSASV